MILRPIEKEKIVDNRQKELKNIIIKSKSLDHETIDRSENLSNNLYQSGKKKEFHKKIIQAIKNAREIICFSSFIISDTEIINELLEASKGGVRVYVLTSPEVYLMDEPDESNEFRKKVKENHENFLKESRNKVLLRGEAGFHSKFILFDPKTNPKGFLFTGNFTTEAFRRNFEIGMELESNQILDFFKQFIIGFWTLSKRENVKEGFLRDVSSFKIETQEPREILTTLGNRSTLKEKIGQLIKNTNGKLVIGIYSFDDNYEITNLMIDEAKKGREIVIFTRKRESNLRVLTKIINYKVTVYLDKFYHAKFIHSESESIIFTANFTKLGLEEGYESGVILTKDQKKRLENLIEEWEEKFSEKLVRMKTLSQLEKENFEKLEIWHKEQILPLKIEKERIIKARDVILADIEEEPQEITINEPNSGPQTEYYQFKFTWSIKPPTLENGAKRVYEIEKGKKTKYPVYEKNNKRFVILEKEKELKKVKDYAKKIKATIIPSQNIT